MSTATAIRERSIIFSGPMVRAAMNDQKTQTRRVVKVPAWADRFEPETFGGITWLNAIGRHPIFGEATLMIRCPYGRPGDHLWCKEGFALRADVDPDTERSKALHYLVYRADVGDDYLVNAWHDYGRGWRSPIHMPRWASRLTFEITEVRVEHLQKITEEDARLEAASFWLGSLDGRAYDIAERQAIRRTKQFDPTAGCLSVRGVFASFWDSLNAKRGYPWESNPFVWAITFRRTESS